MSFQRQPPPPLPSSPKLPTKPDFSGFSFSARFGAPTLLERMGHGPRSSSGPFASSTLVHNPTLETSPSTSLATQESQSLINSQVGSNNVNMSSPRDNQPTVDQEQNQSMELDTPQIGISSPAWRFKSPPPLNALAISDLWADAERVQNEWASVDRTSTEFDSNTCSTDLSQDRSATLSSFNAVSRANSVQASKELSIPAKPASPVHAQLIKQEDITTKEEPEIYTKIEDEETLGQQNLSPFGHVVSGQELEPPTQPERKTTPEESPQQDEHRSCSGPIETPRLSQAVDETDPASDRPESQSPVQKENHKQTQGELEIDNIELPNRPPESRLVASRSSSQPEKRKVHPQGQPGIYSRPNHKVPIHKERGNMRGRGTFPKGQHNARSIGMRQISTQPPMNNGSHAIPIAPRSYRNRGEDFLRASPRPRRSPSPPLRRSPPPRRFSRPRSPLPAPDYPSRRGSPPRSPLRSPLQALTRARSPDMLVGRYSPPPRAHGYGHYSPPLRRFTSRSRSRSPPRRSRSRSPYTSLQRRAKSPPPYHPARRQPTPPVPTTSRLAAYSPRSYTQSDTYAINAGAQDVRYNRSRSFSLSRYASPEGPLNYSVHGTYTRPPASPVSQRFDQGGMRLPFSQDAPPHQQTTFSRNQIEGNNVDSNDRHETVITSLDSRQESEREHTQNLKRKLAEADLRSEPSNQRRTVDEESVVAKRRRVGPSNEEINGIEANAVSQGSQEQSAPQSIPMDQNSSSTPKVPLLSRLAGNTPSIQGSSATPNLVADVHRPLLAQRKVGILEERSPISKRVTTQDVSPAPQPKQTIDSITDSKLPPGGGSSSGGVSLSDRIHGTPGRLPPLAPSAASIPSQPRRHSEFGSNVSLVNRLEGIPSSSFSSQQDTVNTSQSIPLARRITSGISANNHGKPAPHPRRGGYSHGRGGPRNLNGHAAPAPSHLTDQANQTSLANRLR